MHDTGADDAPVIVAGGGWAGLATAVELCRYGIPVTLIEAARQLGGRARSLRFGEAIVDNGQHLVTGACDSLLTLLDRLGIASERAFTRLPLTLHCRNGRQTSLHLKAPRLPAPLHLAAALLSARGLSIKDKLQAIRLGRRLATLELDADEDISVQALLHSEQQTPALIARLWEPLCLATLNTPIGEASARIFLRILRESFTHQRRDSDLLIPRVELNSLLPTPANDFLENNGARVLLGQRVSGLDITADTLRGVRIGEQHLAARQLVLATPHAISRRLMSGQPLLQSLCARLARLGNEPVTTLYLQYPAPLRLPHAMVGLHGGIGQWLFDRGRCGAPGLVAVVISARGEHVHMDNATLTGQIAGELAAAFPKWPGHIDSLLVREKRATFSSRSGVDAVRPPNKTPIAGLWLAGDYTSHGLPATLEGAVRSGVACAHSVIETLSQ